MNPSAMPRFKAPTAPVVAPTTIVAEIEPETTAKVVRPGTRKVLVTSSHDGIVKAKHVEKGQVVRAYLHGGPKGGERVVESVERIGEGEKVLVTFSSAHQPTEYKAAYRFYVEALVGTPTESVSTVPALVAYEEV